MRARRARDSRVYNAKLIELIPCRSCRRGLLAIYHGITVQIRQPRVEPSEALPSTLVSYGTTPLREIPPFSPRPARVMGAAITSCVNKHGSSRWLTPNSSQYPRGSANRHHPFSLMFLPEFYSPFFLWSRGIDSSLPALRRFPRFFNDVIQSCILRQGNQFHIHQKICRCYSKSIKS